MTDTNRSPTEQRERPTADIHPNEAVEIVSPAPTEFHFNHRGRGLPTFTIDPSTGRIRSSW